MSEKLTNKQILALPNKEDIVKALDEKYPGGMECMKKMLSLIGDKPDREGLRETPYRILKSWLEIFSGYSEDPKKILGTFFEEGIGNNNADEIIICRGIKFFSTCEHHFLPFSGVAHIGYLPGDKNRRVIGLSKMARLTECFARRLQIQEQLTSQIVDVMMEVLQPQGCACVIEATHQCMTCRGVKNPSSSMVTSAMRGKFQTQPQTRAEFLSLIK